MNATYYTRCGAKGEITINDALPILVIALKPSLKDISFCYNNCVTSVVAEDRFFKLRRIVDKYNAIYDET